ncbi:hypothetical protein Clacol_005867 [Clathrus columnatus]|uniref:C2H2-type domain-containing protein n=1 Tax=Clathrus columnatus TaxID=1419009 RepID=A0AAV5AGL7_9AGAM|nr:hypothetical protein Clacol_005867 [Clathrus columnatus]
MSSNEQYLTFPQTSRDSEDSADVKGLFTLAHYIQAFRVTPLPENFDELQKIPIECLASMRTPTPAFDGGVDPMDILEGHPYIETNHFKSIGSLCQFVVSIGPKYGSTFPTCRHHFHFDVLVHIYKEHLSKTKKPFFCCICQTSGRSEAKRHFMDYFRGAIFACGEGGCPFRTNRESTLTAHKRNIHGIN